MKKVLIIKRLSLDDAKVLIEGAEEKSREIGIPMCSAVTDEAGILSAFTPMEGANISSSSYAL